MIICICHYISEYGIGRYARAGLRFNDIQFELGVATQCGRRESCARDVVAQCHTESLATLPGRIDHAAALFG